MPTIQAVLFDLDGVLILGDQPIPHAAESLQQLRSEGLAVKVVTNNTLHTRHNIIERLRESGLSLELDDLFLAPRVLARHLMEETPRATVYLIGGDAVEHELTEHGLRVIRNPVEIGYLCDYIVTTTDENFSYESLINALRCHEAGAKFVCVERDPVYPTPGRELLPGGGTIAAAISTMIGQEPTYVAGKPSPHMLLAAVEALGIAPEACLYVGDSLITDRVAAAEAGMPFILVLTGMTERHQALQAGIPESHIINDLRALPERLATLQTES